MSTVEDDTDFVNSFIELITELKPEFVVFERFMVRNRGQSVYAEKINLMLGSIKVLARMYGRCDPIMITAAQWKVYYEKQGKSSESLHPELPSIHQQDAAAIASYADEYWIDEHHQQRTKAKNQ